MVEDQKMESQVIQPQPTQVELFDEGKTKSHSEQQLPSS